MKIDLAKSLFGNHELHIVIYYYQLKQEKKRSEKVSNGPFSITTTLHQKKYKMF